MKRFGTRAVLFATCAFAIVVLWMAASSPVIADNSGQTLLPGSSWLNGQGVDVKSNGDFTGSGNDWGTSSCQKPAGNWVGCGYRWQCVELAQRLYISRGWYSGLYSNLFPVAAAYQIYDEAAAGHMPNCVAHTNGGGYVPVPGDMIIINPAGMNGQYGHVSVVDTVDTAHNIVNAVEQNVSSTTATATYTLSGSTLSRTNWPSVRGIVHCFLNPNTNIPPPPPAVQQGWSTPEALYRYNGPFHFYTANFGELGYGNYGYGLEGVQCHVFSLQGDGMTPLYRYGSRRGLGHFYTTNWNELSRGNSDWAFEQIQCYVFTSSFCWKLWGDTVPLYRYANLVNGDRFYTTNYNELGGGNWMWRYEGVQCWVLP